MSQLCAFKVPSTEDLPESCHVFEVDGRPMIICDPAAGESASFGMRCVGPEDAAVAALCATPLTVDESDPRSVAMGTLYASICGAAQASQGSQGQGQAAQAAQAAAQGVVAASQGEASEEVVEKAAQAAAQAVKQGQSTGQAAAQAAAQAIAQSGGSQSQAAQAAKEAQSQAVAQALPSQAQAAAQAIAPSQAQAQAQAIADAPITMAIFASMPLDAAMGHFGGSATPSFFDRYHGPRY